MMIKIEEYKGSDKEKEFISDAFNSSDVVLFWSPFRRLYESGEEIIRMLDLQLGTYKLYFYYENGIIRCFYIIHAISTFNHRAEIMAFVSPTYRGTTSLFCGWVLLLDVLCRMKVYHLYAKVFDYNPTSMQMAEKNGFSVCGVLPDYIYTKEGITHNVYLLHRLTTLTELERRWLKKCSYDLAKNASGTSIIEA